ncbi:ribonuclease H-like domain-containing protein [Tanacetum coccineum]
MNKGHSFVALLVCVDDIVVTGNDITEINRFKDLLGSKFNIKDLEFGLCACKPISVPMPPNFILPFKPTEEDLFLEYISGYQKLIGKLIYLTHTRPHIAYFVHCLAQHMHSPLKSHVECALDVLRYLKGSPGKGLKYSYDSHSGSLQVYADADWAKCPKTRKFVTGYCVFYNDCLISWKSKKKPLCPNLLPRLNIDRWLQPLVKLFEFKKSLKTLVLNLPYPSLSNPASHGFEVLNNAYASSGIARGLIQVLLASPQMSNMTTEICKIPIEDDTYFQLDSTLPYVKLRMVIPGLTIFFRIERNGYRNVECEEEVTSLTQKKKEE